MCGIIRNISFPFRLKDDPNRCGVGPFELVCENNVTSIYLNSHKYFVKTINYSSGNIYVFNTNIRVVDSSIKNNDTCSFPISSARQYNFNYDLRLRPLYPDFRNSRHIHLMSCPTPLKNSSLFTDISHDCDSINSSHPRFIYIKVGGMIASEVPQTCAVDLIFMTSWEFNGSNSNVSLSEIHHSLLYGIQLYFPEEHKASKWEMQKNSQISSTQDSKALC